MMDYTETAREIVEAYLGRELGWMKRTERHPAARRIALKVWPVSEIIAIEPAGRWSGAPGDLTDGMALDGASGIITLPAIVAPLSAMDAAEWRLRNDSEADGPYLEITYRGGYEELPAPVQTAIGLICSALGTAAANGGQQITYQALDGYQVTYSSKYAEGNSLTMLSPAAAILIEPYKAR